MKKLSPQIEFAHVLGELSVNRNDPCEIIRELISNSYDARASHIYYAPIEQYAGLVFLDNGSGLSPLSKKNGITPWEAFFSIGKSTKKKGDGIGYKCQGSKLCFACARIFVATRDPTESGAWYFKILENPRSNLNVNTNIQPDRTLNLTKQISDLFPQASAQSSKILEAFNAVIESLNNSNGTLIIIDDLDTENFIKYFSVGDKYADSYLYNYIRFNTCHGDTRSISKKQGFTQSQVHQLSPKIFSSQFSLFSGETFHDVPFGFPYLGVEDADLTIKTPSQISRLRDGRF